MARPGTVWQGPVRLGRVGFGVARQGIYLPKLTLVTLADFGRFVVRIGAAWRGTALHGAARRVEARHGEAW